MRRSRKPVWAFRSIGGSNPPLSVFQPVFRAFSRRKCGSRTVAVGTARGSTRANAGPVLGDFVPPTFPPDVAEIVGIDPPIGKFTYLIEKRSATFRGKRSVSTRISAERPIVNAGHASRHPFQGVAA